MLGVTFCGSHTGGSQEEVSFTDGEEETFGKFYKSKTL